MFQTQFSTEPNSSHSVTTEEQTYTKEVPLKLRVFSPLLSSFICFLFIHNSHLRTNGSLSLSEPNIIQKELSPRPCHHRGVGCMDPGCSQDTGYLWALSIWGTGPHCLLLPHS